MSVVRIIHCCINVRDMAEALVFFRDLLGFEVTNRGTHDPAQIGPFNEFDFDPDVEFAVVTCPDGSEIELLEWKNPQGKLADTRNMIDVGICVVTLLVEDVDAMVERLKDGGYPPKGPIVGWGPDGSFRAVHLHGPGGIPVTIGTIA